MLYVNSPILSSYNNGKFAYLKWCIKGITDKFGMWDILSKNSKLFKNTDNTLNSMKNWVIL